MSIEITDEMVRSALAEWYAWNGEDVSDDAQHTVAMRAALAAALMQAKVASQQAGAVAWLVVDAKGKRFTIYNPMLAEVVKREAEQTGSTLTVKAVCEIPPTGWYCTRQPGHDGPCAAWENVRPSVTMPDPEKACAIWTTPTTSKAESNAFLAGARAMLAAAPEVQS
jgi:hypothetical protein